jgi:hypothetical protein
LRCGWHFFSFSPLGSAQSGGSAKIQPWLAYIIDPPLFYIFFFFFVRSFAGWLLSASVCWMASVPPVKGEEISFDISKADLLSLPLSLYAPRKHKEEIIKLYTEKKGNFNFFAKPSENWLGIHFGTNGIAVKYIYIDTL